MQFHHRFGEHTPGCRQGNNKVDRLVARSAGGLVFIIQIFEGELAAHSQIGVRLSFGHRFNHAQLPTQAAVRDLAGQRLCGFEHSLIGFASDEKLN